MYNLILFNCKSKNDYVSMIKKWELLEIVYKIILIEWLNNSIIVFLNGYTNHFYI